VHRTDRADHRPRRVRPALARRHETINPLAAARHAQGLALGRGADKVLVVRREAWSAVLIAV
jgi:hypothetical protein